jgi:hypothetical protein
MTMSGTSTSDTSTEQPTVSAITEPLPTRTAFGPWEGAAFMATGAALVVHILADVPLWLSAAMTVSVGGCVMFLAVRRHPEGVAAGRRVIGAGAVAAFAALLAYDGIRMLVVTAFDYGIGPFDAFEHFGAGLIGASASEESRTVAGALFHVVNAISFGIAYTIWVGRRGVLVGVLFGLGLEAAMIAFYPAWLQIPNLREFISMSVTGHIAYGAVLGAVARRGRVRAGV